MKFLLNPRVRIALTILVVAYAGYLAWRGSRLARNVFHTRLLFTQLDEQYGKYLSAGNPVVTTTPAFMTLIGQWPIDWQSCRLQDGTLYDAWGWPVHWDMQDGTILLTSPGPDGNLETPDDLKYGLKSGSPTTGAATPATR